MGKMTGQFGLHHILTIQFLLYISYTMIGSGTCARTVPYHYYGRASQVKLHEQMIYCIYSS